MKIFNDSDAGKNTFLIFNQGKNQNYPKKNLTKTRNETNYNFFNLNNKSNGLQELGFNNTLKTKPKPTFYPTLNFKLSKNINNNNNNFFGNSPNNFNPLNAGNNMLNNISGQNSNKSNGYGYMMFKTENNFSSNMVQNNDEKMDIEEKKEECDFTVKKKKRKAFDSNFNLLEDQLGSDDLDQMLKEFWHLKINTTSKKNPSSFNVKEEKSEKKEVMYTNTGDSLQKEKKNKYIFDSVNFFEDNDSGKKQRNNFDMVNPYLKSVNKK